MTTGAFLIAAVKCSIVLMITVQYCLVTLRVRQRPVVNGRLAG